MNLIISSKGFCGLDFELIKVQYAKDIWCPYEENIIKLRWLYSQKSAEHWASEKAFFPRNMILCVFDEYIYLELYVWVVLTVSVSHELWAAE